MKQREGGEKEMKGWKDIEREEEEDIRAYSHETDR